MRAIKSLEIDTVSTIAYQFILLARFVYRNEIGTCHIMSSYFYSDAQLVPIVTAAFSLNIQVKLNYIFRADAKLLLSERE